MTKRPLDGQEGSGMAWVLKCSGNAERKRQRRKWTIVTVLTLPFTCVERSVVQQGCISIVTKFPIFIVS